MTKIVVIYIINSINYNYKATLMKNFFTASNIAKLGIFSALAVILYFLNFPLPFFPPFLEIHLSDLPALICGFTLGPIGGVLTVVIKILIKLKYLTVSPSRLYCQLKIIPFCK